MYLQDGNEDGAIATVTEDTPAPNNMLQFDVHQQVIMHGDGVKVQVVRFVQLGRQQPVDLREHLVEMGGDTLEDVALKALDAARGSNASDGDDTAAVTDGEGNDEDENKDPGDPESPSPDLVNVHGHRGTEETITKQRKRAEKENNPDGEPDDMAKTLPAPPGMKQVKPGVFEAKGPVGTDDWQQEWNKHRMEKHHQLHHHRQDTTTKTLVKVTQVKMKLLNEEEDERDHEKPPESMFAKLAPSRDRYTLLRDEL